VVDRNQTVVENFKLRAQQRAFSQALAAGQVAAVDQLGRGVAAGDLVYVDSTQARVFQVMEISPVLDPSMPPGTVRVLMQAQTAYLTPANQPMPGVILVQPAELTRAMDAAADDLAGDRETPEASPAPIIALTDRD
jgi:hypothetical protein